MLTKRRVIESGLQPSAFLDVVFESEPRREQRAFEWRAWRLGCLLADGGLFAKLSLDAARSLETRRVGS